MDSGSAISSRADGQRPCAHPQCCSKENLVTYKVWMWQREAYLRFLDKM